MTSHIAMWSGPRNISTAMMRAWGNRDDTFVCDEPLYAYYLLTTGHTDHPGYHETVREHETDWRAVVPWLTGPVPNGKKFFYQKHMTHHMLPEVALDWALELTNCFLIREPAEVLLSLVEFLPAPSAEETGLPDQARIFEFICDRTGSVPPVIDARDVLVDPPRIMRALCERLRVPFDVRMLQWPPGPRDTDGAWAPYWYNKVYDTTGFGTYRPKSQSLPPRLNHVLDVCRPLYERLYEHRLQLTAKD